MIIKKETKLPNTLKKNALNYKDDRETVKCASHRQVLQLYVENITSAHFHSNV